MNNKWMIVGVFLIAVMGACSGPASMPTDLLMVPKGSLTGQKPQTPETMPQSIPASQAAAEAPFLQVPTGLDNTNLLIPPSNPLTIEKVELGRLLYFDPRLSADGTVSCATCHDPQKGWTDQAPVSTGIRGQMGTRNAPTVMNATTMVLQFWDGRAATLEEQALGPLVNPIEMGNRSHDEVVKRISAIAGYRPYFEKAFGTGVTKENLAQAIASFERTVLSGNSRHDRYVAGDSAALNEAEVRGMQLFFGKGNCARCHAGPNFSDSLFHNLGVGVKSPTKDWGRFVVTLVRADRGAFKTPTLRELTKTAPYMHDGSQKTLEEVITFYNKGGEKNPWLDPLVVPLGLTDPEKADLVAFMKALDGEPYPMVTPPELPQ